MSGKVLRGKAGDVMQRLIDTAENGNIIEPLANAVIMHKGGPKPSLKWSTNNRFFSALQGASDPRGYRQWNQVDRFVKKGAKPVYILIPLTKAWESEDENGNKVKKYYTYGYGSATVFDISDTDGEPIEDDDTLEFIHNLPLKNAAEKLGINITTYDSREESALAFYERTKKKDDNGNVQINNPAISLGVMSNSAFLHELVHAADDRLGNLTEKGQNVLSETVAQAGAEILLNLLGLPPNLGFTVNYIKGYTQKNHLNYAETILSVVERTVKAVEFLIDLSKDGSTIESVLNGSTAENQDDTAERM